LNILWTNLYRIEENRLKFPTIVLPVAALFSATIALSAQSQVDQWLNRVSATQAAQPHWITPVATVTPRLEQEFRFDTFHQITPAGNVTNLDAGKGLELIPTRNTELLINLPPYLLHQNPKTLDGWGDASFTMKYRFLARNEQHGGAILTGFLAGSVPSGSHKNGSISAVVTPTLAAGKGWGLFDVQTTLGGTFPANSVKTLGRTIASNTAFQYHATKALWPEVEINSTIWEGGANDGKKQTFVTPGLVLGRFPIHKRVAVVAGAGFQVAATHYNQYNHAFIGTLRLPF
jgi:hypothetical protein